MRKKVNLIFFLLFLIIKIQNACLNYTNGDTYPTNSSSYCVSLIKWQVSEQTFETTDDRDNVAQANYQNLYKNYYKKNKVTIDCLGIAKYFFCADAYPTCSGSEMKINKMCDWMCTLFSVRCGEDNQFYRSICINGKTAVQQCSSEENLRVLEIIGFLVLLLIFQF